MNAPPQQEKKPLGFFRTVWQWLLAPGNQSSDHDDDIQKIDVAKLAKELNLAAEGKRLGEAGLPPPEATTLYGPESACVQRVEQARQGYVTWAQRRLNILSRDLGHSDVTSEVNRALQAHQEFEREASSVLNRHEGVLARLSEQARQRRRELQDFKARHRLTRDADYPDSTGRFKRIGFLGLLLLVEAGLNTKFFAEGLDLGLLGGAIEALTAAFFNVVIAFVLGWLVVRFVFHSSVAFKCLGVLGSACAVGVMVFVGLFISHYRGAVQSESARAWEVAGSALWDSPLALQGSAWGLFAVSITFAIFALLDGISFDDLHPHYGAYSRRARTAEDDHQDEMDAVREELEQLKQEQLQALDRTLERAQSSIAVFESTIRDKHSAGNRLATLMADADNSLEALLQTFRAENELARNGVPRPAYFDTYPKLRELPLPNFDTTADEQSLAMQKALVRRLVEGAEQLRGNIQTAFNKQFDGESPLATHFPGKEVA
ncbi:hypothetical protein FSC37_09265 [Piscinibacter aquaticus]|uniref:Transmembrane protein n=1 Tax=Piscinibacter aquaticus TaxID=392597 RepID=A0A5C6TZI9_9BURK|nr:hypothetical protein FSC37_09265 [Piscinibacter aquaticus]